ncbi:uncharacterized protein LOC109018889, partial [Juglans regia]|uniref:Uncharacterized protein LOC109018889 n=1 Tax=Juglans regia TaxID=51240 RepID=A0A6P9E6Q7_JUGRE
METNTFSLELLTNDNYADWSVKMKNNLLAQGLWDIVETCSKPPKPDDDVVEFKTWKKMNAAALHAIQSSCGMDILSRISKISSAKIAWETLAEMFMEMRLVLYNTVEQGHSCSSDTLDSGQDMPTGTGANQKVESGNSSSAHKSGNMETNTLPLELPIGTGANQRVEGGNFSDNQGRSNSSNILDNGQNMIIQIEDDNSIIDKGNFSSSSSPGSLREDDYTPLVEAVQRGNWNATIDFLKDHPAALTARIFISGGTILHAAVEAEQEYIVEELVNMISEHNNLAIQDHGGQTALHRTTIGGNQGMAECLITQNRSLVSIRDNKNKLPVAMAMGWGHKKLARYLYSQTPFQDLEADQGLQGATLLINSINTRDLGFKRLYGMKLVRAQFQRLLTLMCQESQRNQFDIKILSRAMFGAIKRGNFEFVYNIVKANSDLLRMSDVANRSIFHCAVLHRQHRIFSLIYNFKKKNAQLLRIDKSGNVILHMAGMLTENTAIDHIRGAALQMQREVQWFQ